jgi:hypothetical protein
MAGGQRGSPPLGRDGSPSPRCASSLPDAFMLHRGAHRYRPYRRAVVAFMRWQQARGVLNASSPATTQRPCRCWKTSKPKRENAACGTGSARSRRRRANQPAVCAAGRNHRPQPTHRAGYVELRGPRHGQHRIVGRLRQLRTAKALAASLLDGEIRSAFAMTEPAVAFGCAQRRHQHRPRRRQLRDQRAQMVHLRCAEPPLRRQAWPRSGGCAPPGPPSARARRC